MIWSEGDSVPAHAARLRDVRELTDGWLDILTGHASARFKWIDVRSAQEWQDQPPPPGIAHIPLEDLPARARDEFKRKDELIVYGSDDSQTAEAEKVLQQLGFKNVDAVKGGFAILKAKLFR